MCKFRRPYCLFFFLFFWGGGGGGGGGVCILLPLIIFACNGCLIQILHWHKMRFESKGDKVSFSAMARAQTHELVCNGCHIYPRAVNRICVVTHIIHKCYLFIHIVLTHIDHNILNRKRESPYTTAILIKKPHFPLRVSIDFAHILPSYFTGSHVFFSANYATLSDKC